MKNRWLVFGLLIIAVYGWYFYDAGALVGIYNFVREWPLSVLLIFGFTYTLDWLYTKFFTIKEQVTQND